MKAGGKPPEKFIYMAKEYKEVKMAQTSRNLGERSAELSLTRHFNFFNNYYAGASLGSEA